MNKPTQASQLGTYLRDRRTRLDPAALGFSGRRRTPGLRREEVAQRANISPTWYTWLEQGRGGAPSPDVLDRIASGLMLTEPEREHLFMLGLGRPPEIRYKVVDGVTPRLQRVLDALQTSPAIVKTALWDVIAWNRAAAAVFTDYARLPREQRNILRLMFADAHVRAAQEDWRSVARFVVAAFRAPPPPPPPPPHLTPHRGKPTPPPPPKDPPTPPHPTRRRTLPHQPRIRRPLAQQRRRRQRRRLQTHPPSNSRPDRAGVLRLRRRWQAGAWHDGLHASIAVGRGAHPDFDGRQRRLRQATGMPMNNITRDAQGAFLSAPSPPIANEGRTPVRHPAPAKPWPTPKTPNHRAPPIEPNQPAPPHKPWPAPAHPDRGDNQRRALRPAPATAIRRPSVGA